MKTKELNQNPVGRTLQVIYLGFYLIFSLAAVFAAYDAYSSFKTVNRQNTNLEYVQTKRDIEAMKQSYEKQGLFVSDLSEGLEKTWNVDLPYFLEKEDPLSTAKTYGIVFGVVFVAAELISLGALYILGFSANTLLVTFIQSQQNQ